MRVVATVLLLNFVTCSEMNDGVYGFLFLDFFRSLDSHGKYVKVSIIFCGNLKCDKYKKAIIK